MPQPLLARQARAAARYNMRHLVVVLGSDKPVIIPRTASFAQVYDEPTVLLARHVSGEEEVPVGVVGLIRWARGLPTCHDCRLD